MLETLRVLLCCVGAVYLAMRLFALMRLIAGGRRLLSPSCEVSEDDDCANRGIAAGRRDKGARRRERTTV
ncbi:MAG: hypothetical protein GX448_01845 [Planctomycetes bacterium]|nr:hypothetical protein [Planctomycetota bacterium]